MRKQLRIACYIASLLIGIGIGAVLSAPTPLSFEERWSPVYQIDNGLKGDRLNPVAKPKSNKQVLPAGVRLALAECQSFCEFP